MRLIVLVGALLCLAGGAKAALISIDLPELLGSFTFSTVESQTVSFDFDQNFVEVRDAWLEIEATVTPKQFLECGTFTAPAPCTQVTQFLGFLALMDKEGSLQPGLVFTGVNGFSGTLHLASGMFLHPSVNLTPFLRDGQGSFIFAWSNLFGDPDAITRNLVPPTGDILSARLILDVVPVPEPSGGSLVALSLLGIAWARRRNCGATAHLTQVAPVRDAGRCNRLAWRGTC